MKLLACQKCGEIFSLSVLFSCCGCGQSAGYYTSNVNATVMGPCTVLGISNRSYQSAAACHEVAPYGPNGDNSVGWRFEAFIIPEGASSIRRINA